jgi:hypothetical protein
MRSAPPALPSRYAPRIANNGQQGKSPGCEAGARLGFACHGGQP